MSEMTEIKITSRWRKQDSIRRYLEATVIYIFREAIAEEWTFAEILKRIAAQVYNHADMNKIPVYMRTEIYGYVKGMFDLVQDRYIEWTLLYNSKVVTGADIPAGEWDKVKAYGSVWKGSHRPYNLVEDEGGKKV